MICIEMTLQFFDLFSSHFVLQKQMTVEFFKNVCRILIPKEDTDFNKEVIRGHKKFWSENHITSAIVTCLPSLLKKLKFLRNEFIWVAYLFTLEIVDSSISVSVSFFDIFWFWFVLLSNPWFSWAVENTSNTTNKIFMPVVPRVCPSLLIFRNKLKALTYIWSWYSLC